MDNKSPIWAVVFWKTAKPPTRKVFTTKTQADTFAKKLTDCERIETYDPHNKQDTILPETPTFLAHKQKHQKTS